MDTMKTWALILFIGTAACGSDPVEKDSNDNDPDCTGVTATTVQEDPCYALEVSLRANREGKSLTSDTCNVCSEDGACGYFSASDSNQVDWVADCDNKCGDSGCETVNDRLENRLAACRRGAPPMACFARLFNCGECAEDDDGYNTGTR